MLSDYKKHLLDKVQAFPKGDGFKFRINQENFDYLTLPESECNEDQYYGNKIGLYFKCVIEEYARKPYRDREYIYYLDRFDTINEAIKNQKQLMVTFSDGRTCYVIPWAIKTDPLSMYYYIIGYSSQVHNSCESEERAFSYRISRLKKVDIRKNRGAFLSKERNNTLCKLFDQRGAQFMSGEDKGIVVWLSETGQQMYKRVLHLRPPYCKEPFENKYTFHCTEAQAEFYFFKFGKEAMIISPESLRVRFGEMYKEASEFYCSN